MLKLKKLWNVPTIFLGATSQIPLHHKARSTNLKTEEPVRPWKPAAFQQSRRPQLVKRSPPTTTTKTSLRSTESTTRSTAPKLASTGTKKVAQPIKILT